ncbi:MAG: DUF1285 domain-containing protein [Candidatus Rokubacteria bacterium]|nr:DUF1285 domain-containing protein [Candidatus Rokubacteria bacterium]
MSTPEPSEWSLPQLKIDRDGEWLNEGTEITHAGIVANLRGNLRRDAQGYYVQAGPVRIPVDVEDTPFTVVRVEAEENGIRLTLNDGSQEPLDPRTLRLALGEVPYCRVKGNQFEARLTRAAAWQLARFIQYDEGANQATLVLAGARYPLRGP